jgi:predicted SnoaL-like aldol condensation-catalyzing enzyme
MPAEENKAMIRHFYDEVWNNGNLRAIDEYVAPDYLDHDSQIDPLGIARAANAADPRARVKQAVGALRAAFPDVQFITEYQVAEGDMVVTYYTAHATQTGPLGPIPATHRSAAIAGVYLDRISGGQIVESWSLFDSLGLLQQLGVLKTPELRPG